MRKAIRRLPALLSTSCLASNTFTQRQSFRVYPAAIFTGAFQSTQVLRQVKVEVEDDCTCRLCHRTLKTAEGLTHHYGQKHPNETIPSPENAPKIIKWKCEFCGKLFSQMPGCRDHMASAHAGETKPVVPQNP